jgi:hypothetical protein
MIITHAEISARARAIWEQEGRPEGRDKEHWLQAEAELRQESLKDQGGNNIQSADDSMLRVPEGLAKENGSRKRTVRRK